MTCRDEILACVHQFVREGGHEFSVQEVVDAMHAAGTTYAESTIRTHVTSRMCANAPKNHPVKYNDFVRVYRGVYELAH